MKKKLLLISVLLAAIVGALAFLVFKPRPQYCRLVFGPKANLRVLVRLQGKKLFMDRDNDGKFSGLGEQFSNLDECRDVVFADPDGQTTYTITGMSRNDDPGPPRRTDLIINVHVKGSLEYSQYCDVELAASPHDAKDAHFHGPLTIEPTKVLWKLPPDLALQKGDEPMWLRVNTGTMNAEKGCWVVVSTQEGVEKQPTFPKGVHPIVDVEFPPKHEGAPPIKQRYPLDEPC